MSMQVKPEIVFFSGVRPSSPAENTIYFDQTNNQYIWHVNGQWIPYPKFFGW